MFECKRKESLLTGCMLTSSLGVIEKMLTVQQLKRLVYQGLFHLGKRKIFPCSLPYRTPGL
jgi:hypothetical protein